MKNKSFLGEKKRERGATIVEYVLLIGLIAICMIGTLTAFGQRLSYKMNQASLAIGQGGFEEPSSGD